MNKQCHNDCREVKVQYVSLIYNKVKVQALNGNSPYKQIVKRIHLNQIFSSCQWMSHRCRQLPWLELSWTFVLVQLVMSACIQCQNIWMLAACTYYLGHWVLPDIMRLKSLRYKSVVQWILQKRRVVKTHQHSAQGRSAQALSTLALSFVTELLICHLHVAHHHSNTSFPYLIPQWEPRVWWCWIMLICCGK